MGIITRLAVLDVEAFLPADAARLPVALLHPGPGLERHFARHCVGHKNVFVCCEIMKSGKIWTLPSA